MFPAKLIHASATLRPAKRTALPGLDAIIIGSGPDVSFDSGNEAPWVSGTQLQLGPSLMPFASCLVVGGCCPLQVALSWLLLGLNSRELLVS